ncbi:unnamed protein product [Caenorhabditis angaria]|uniref:BTB domain-containing protein n=1 Tax=Caenorhabditis angaria TaxID=860376 RepID=A0A9P1ICW3_9PELO|nr:unnamed protein product [Caenorhabditis angaria]
MPLATEKFVFEVNSNDLANRKITSAPIIIGGFPWKLAAWKKTGSSQYLALELFCNPDSLNNIWSCTADVKFTIGVIVGDHQIEPDEKVFENQKFESTKKSIVYDQVMLWENYINPENGFVSTNNSSIFNAFITIRSDFGITKDAFYEMKKRWEETADGVVVIDDKRIKVNKGFLSFNSTYFHTLFNGGFAEQLSDEIHLNDVEYNAFVEMLDVLIDARRQKKPITEHNVASLLQMADMYDIKPLVSDCVDFLLNTSNVDLYEKLRLSAVYGLSAVQEKCLQSMTNLDSIVKFAKSPSFNDLPIDTQLLILYRILEHIN